MQFQSNSVLNNWWQHRPQVLVDVKLLSSVGCGNRKCHKFIQNSPSQIVLTVFSPTNKCLLTLVWVDSEQMHGGFIQNTAVGTELLIAFQLLCFGIGLARLCLL